MHEQPKKRSSSSLSYRTAQNASYKQVKKQRKPAASQRVQDAQNQQAVVPRQTPPVRTKKRRKRRGCLGRLLLPLVLLVLIILSLSLNRWS